MRGRGECQARHNRRHTYATILLVAGKHEVGPGASGSVSARITFEVCGHLTEGT